MNYCSLQIHGGRRRVIPRKPISRIETIETMVCGIFNMNPGDTKQKTRKREIVKPAQIVSTVARVKYNQTLKQIGDFYEKDHCTIVARVKAIQGYIFSKDTEAIQALKRIGFLLGDETIINKIKDYKWNWKGK